MEIYDIIIIGGGPAGMTAALYACRQNRNTLLLEKDFFGGQASKSPHIENFPGFDGPGEELMTQFRASLRKLTNFKVEFEEATHISQSENNYWKIETTSESYLTKAVILATGLHHKTINLPNEDELVKDGVLSYCTLCDGRFFEDGITAVIGDSFTASQYALDLSKYCRRVYIVALGDKLYCEQAMIDRINKTDNIEVCYNYNTTKIEYITGSNKQLVGLYNENSRQYDVIVNGVFIAIGRESSITADLFDIQDRVWLLDDKNLIKAYPHNATALRGLYAAGDCMNKTSPRQVITAASDGATAAIEADKYIESEFTDED